MTETDNHKSADDNVVDYLWKSCVNFFLCDATTDMAAVANCF